MKFLFDDESFSFETLRAAGFALYGGADLGEVLVTAAAITGGDEASWHRAWKATAERLQATGEQALAAGHRVSAREALLRASNYYRAAEFLLRENPATDPEVTLMSARSWRRRSGQPPRHPGGDRHDPLRGHHAARLPVPGRRLRHAAADGDLHQRVRLHRGGVLVRDRRRGAAPRVQRAGLRRPGRAPRCASRNLFSAPIGKPSSRQ
jgi:hypothetical protein